MSETLAHRRVCVWVGWSRRQRPCGVEGGGGLACGDTRGGASVLHRFKLKRRLPSHTFSRPQAPPHAQANRGRRTQGGGVRLWTGDGEVGGGMVLLVRAGRVPFMGLLLPAAWLLLACAA